MKFNPIDAAMTINETYRDYMKSTFFIRDEVFRESYTRALETFEFAKGPYLECVDAFVLSKSLKSLVKEGLLSPSFEQLFKNDTEQYNRPLYKHQEEAIRLALDDKNMVVSTGTGSGKTECFTYPILHSLLEEERAGTLGPGVRVLLLYPMNALANDQMQRLRKLLKDYPAITFGSYTGETEEHQHKALSSYKALYPGQEILPNELISRAQMKETPPHILVTNYAMLEYLLIRPTDTVLFDNKRFNSRWKYIVLDEAHVYSGASGMEVSILLRRLINRLPKPEQIRFILTSATLGDEHRDDDIVKFATTLCAKASFDASSIVRASRQQQDCRPAFSGKTAFYEEVIELLESDEHDEERQRAEVLTVIREHGYSAFIKDGKKNLEQMLYELFIQDEMYEAIRGVVKSGSIDLKSLVDALGVSEKKVVAFINIANRVVRNGGKLLDARYHHFIRTLEGAYITFYPKRTLSLYPRNFEVIDAERYKCYKLSVCQFCGTNYLEGVIKGGFLIQDEGEGRDYFMQITEEFFAFDDDESAQDIHRGVKDKQGNAHWLCSTCGQTSRYGQSPSCGCDSRGHILLYKCPVSEDQILHQCHHCRTIRSRGSVLRGFFLGQDASAAVIGEALYNQIPAKRKVTERVIGQQSRRTFSSKRVERSVIESRQLLLFSDSRQEAAYFASYFQNTYDVVFNRRIIMRVARNLLHTDSDIYDEGIPLSVLATEMVRYISGVLKDSRDINEIRLDVWKAILGELMNLSRNSLRGVGWLDYQLKTEDLLNQGCTFGSTTITPAQMDELSLFFLQYCMRFGAVHPAFDIHLSAADYQEMVFSKNEPAIQEANLGVGYSGFTLRSFIPMTHNSVSDYLNRVYGMEQEAQRDFLLAVFSEYLTDSGYAILTPVVGEQSLFKVNPLKVMIRVQGHHQLEHYRCDVCGQITTINVNKVCPFYRCSGTLHPYLFNPRTSKSYFINQYAPDTPIIPLVVKEHTAQLSKDRAKKYQRKFIQGEINALSCTTTFEMGVDVGDLETVFMKNVPPKPSNYVQRAGRAGRRLKSAAFSLTFCKLGPHDFYYFNRPTDMIDGIIQPPIFKIDNPKIVKRHVFAVLLSSYWRALYADKSKISDFLNAKPFSQIVEYLRAVPQEVITYLEAVLPQTLRSSIDEFIDEYIVLLIGVQQRFTGEIAEYEEAIAIELAKDDSKGNSKKYKKLDWWDSAKKTHEEESLISYYSRANLIPKYGFPVDTVTLFTNARSTSYTDTGSALSLQRDLIQAINEYAPDSEIIADGQLYTSRYVKLPHQQEWTWRLQWVQQCQNPNCGKVVVENYVDQDLTRKGICAVCGESQLHSQKMLQPEYGFIIDPNVSAIKGRRPRRSQRTEFYYLGGADPQAQLKPKEHQIGKISLSVISCPDDRLLVMNRSQFMVCRECGYAERLDSTNWSVTGKRHNNPRGYPCSSSTLELMALGHTFKTDVVLISVEDKLEHPEALTTLYALLEGCSQYFDVERDDIDGCISYQSYVAEGGSTGTTFVLFDSVPGGAGNVKRIYEATKIKLVEFLESALERVTNCNCGGEEGDMVCYNCLATFRNQFHQGVMQRRFAINILNQLLDSSPIS
jgi:hypothetical protein